MLVVTVAISVWLVREVWEFLHLERHPWLWNWYGMLSSYHDCRFHSSNNYLEIVRCAAQRSKWKRRGH